METPEVERRSFDRSRDLQENLDYADDLGAEVVRVTADRVADGLVETLRRRRATHLLVPYHEGRTVAGWRRPTLAEQVLADLPSLDVHIVAPDERPH